MKGIALINLLHAHTGHEHTLIEGLLDEVLLHGVLDTLKLVPFLFLTYLLMEFIEHKAQDKTREFMQRAGALAPLAGGALGAVPQCGISAAMANLYTGRIISVGTIVAVLLSTSDEMLPILIAGNIRLGTVLAIIGYKAGCAIAAGFAVDLVLRLIRHAPREIEISEFCTEDNCHCDEGILRSALHHTLTISGFVLAITLALNTAVYFIGTETIASVIYGRPFISHLLASVVGLIPNCAVSVALTSFCLEGLITVGTMLSGLFSGAGVGLLVLFRTNKRIKENLLIVGLLVLFGTLFGFVADLIPIFNLR